MDRIGLNAEILFLEYFSDIASYRFKIVNNITSSLTSLF